ncbi:MAG: choice-of-anchor L domain-containing protein, partial [Ferruginibacter sp.]
SNEYGTYQCGFADVFAFLLTNITTGVTTNVAVIPGTTIPVSVLTIRDNAYNAGCPSVNPQFFGQFNQTLPAVDTPINMRGQTVVFNASAVVIPNNQYSIKLTIGDYQDTAFDSAVFIEGGSFNVGSASVGGTGQYEGFGDLTVANGAALCPGLCQTIRAGSSPIANATYQWSKDGVVIPGETTFELQVCEAGEYCATVLIGGGTTCQQTDCATVEVLPIPNIQTGDDLYSCNTTWNLTQNSSFIINGLSGEVTYHLTLQDALDVANQIPNLVALAYPGTDGQIIYVAVQVDGEPCIYTSTFQIFELDSTITPLTTVIPALCDVNADGFEVFDFSIATTNALNGLAPTEYTVTYHTSLADATNNIGAINPTNFNGSNNQIIYIRVEQNCDPTNFATTQITLLLTTIPVPDDPLDVASCDCYTLPPLTVGNYFGGTNGSGTSYNAGDIICGTGAIPLFVFAETNTTPNNCTSENSFTITFIQTPVPSAPADVTFCDSYQLPVIASGNYYSGPGGTGTSYIAGDVISSTMTMYVYVTSGTVPNCTAENSFLITINPSPIADILPPVTVCDSYTLPSLTVGN